MRITSIYKHNNKQSLSRSSIIKRSAKQQLWILISIFISTILFGSLLSFLSKRHEYLDLLSTSRLLIPPQDTKEMINVRNRLLNEICKPPKALTTTRDKNCGEWRKMTSTQFQKLTQEKLSTVFLITDVDLRRIVNLIKKNNTGLRPIDKLQSPLNFDFGVSYGEIRVWIDGSPIGRTSRNFSLPDKPRPYSFREVIPIPAQNIPKNETLSRVIIEVRSLTSPNLPHMYRLQKAVVEDSQSSTSHEMLKILMIVASSATIFIIGLYHLILWFWRRDIKNLAIIIACSAVFLFCFSYFHLGFYLNFPASMLWRLHVLMLYAPPLLFGVFRLFTNDAPSELFSFYNPQTIRQPAMRTFNKKPLTILAILLAETNLYIVIPALILVTLLLPIWTATYLLANIAMPLLIVTSIGTSLHVLYWHYRESLRRNNRKYMMVSAGYVIFQGNISLLYLDNTYTHAYNHSNIALAAVVFILLLAVSLGQEFILVYRRLDMLKSRLEKVLHGTRQMAASHKELDTLFLSCRLLLKELSTEKETAITAYLFPKEENLFSSQTTVTRVELMSKGRFQHPPIVLETPFKTNEYIIESLNHNYPTMHSSGTLYCPIRLGGRKFGVLVFSGYRKNFLTNDDRRYIGAICASLAVSLQNIFYLEQTRQGAIVEAELDAARAVQEALLPRTQELPGVDVTAWYQAAAKTGGDWYGYYYNEVENRIYFYIGDVTGHGVSSALLTGVACGAVYSSEYTTNFWQSEGSSPPDRLRNLAHVLNKVINETGRQNLMMTMALFSLDLESGELLYLNAGHIHPFIYCRESQKPKVLMGKGSMLGESEPEFEIKRTVLKEGDGLFLFTDGLVENRNKKGNYLKRRTISQLLKKSPTAHMALNLVLESAIKIWEDSTPEDDVTILSFQWRGSYKQSRRKPKPENKKRPGFAANNEENEHADLQKVVAERKVNRGTRKVSRNASGEKRSRHSISLEEEKEKRSLAETQKIESPQEDSHPDKPAPAKSKLRKA